MGPEDPGGAEGLVCPVTTLPLRAMPLAEARDLVAGGRELVSRRSRPATVGPTPMTLVRSDGGCAYPVVDGVAVLLAPERLVAPDADVDVDLAAPRYAEAYAEMDFYNQVATREGQVLGTARLPEEIARVAALPDSRRQVEFPHPGELWLDAAYEAAAQWDAYRHLAPLRGKRVLQVGGKGWHAVKFLLAGAQSAWLLSPMLSELHYATALAAAAGVADRLRCVAGISEEIPLGDDTVDAIYSGGCVHHLVTEMAADEWWRVLAPGGSFAAVEPWRAPFYGIGTQLLGKREVEVHCRPLVPQRLQPFAARFPGFRVVHHGSLTRYPLLALQKAGLPLRLRTLWRVNRVDDAVSDLVPRLREAGSCVALLGYKPGVPQSAAPEPPVGAAQ